MDPEKARFLNILGLLGLSALLGAAFFDQFWLAELPCPLCLLQRAGFIAAGVGIVLNITTQPRPSHYGMTIVSAIFGGAIAARQTLLHIVPGSGSFGSALWGLHFYSWALVAFGCIALAGALMLMFDGQFRAAPEQARSSRRWGALAAVFLFVAIALLNAGSTLAECGLGLCPDDPTGYQLFSSAPANP